MWTPNKSAVECLAESEPVSEIQPTPFRQVYDFILQAVKGDKATADAIFEDYLAGKLSEELLSISRPEEGWRGDKLRAGRGDGVNDDALSTTVA